MKASVAHQLEAQKEMKMKVLKERKILSRGQELPIVLWRRVIRDLHRKQFLDKKVLRSKPTQLQPVLLRLEVDILIAV